MGSLDELDGFFIPVVHTHVERALLLLENEYYQRNLSWGSGWQQHCPDFMNKLHTARAQIAEGR